MELERKDPTAIVVGSVVLTLLVAALAMAAFTQKSSSSAARRAKASSDILALESAIQLFKIDTGRIPTASEGLRVLVASHGVKSWHGPYTSSLPSDPWKRPYLYAPNPSAPKGFDVTSWGSDGSPGGTGEAEDISLK